MPRLFAVVEIIKHPDYYGFSLPYVKNTPYFTTISLHKPQPLATVAKLAGLNWMQFHQLNPGYRRWTLTANQTQAVLLPVSNTAHFYQQQKYYEIAALRASQHIRTNYSGPIHPHVARKNGKSSSKVKHRHLATRV